MLTTDTGLNRKELKNIAMETQVLIKKRIPQNCGMRLQSEKSTSLFVDFLLTRCR